MGETIRLLRTAMQPRFVTWDGYVRPPVAATTPADATPADAPADAHAGSGAIALSGEAKVSKDGAPVAVLAKGAAEAKGLGVGPPVPSFWLAGSTGARAAAAAAIHKATRAEPPAGGMSLRGMGLREAATAAWAELDPNRVRPPPAAAAEKEKDGAQQDARAVQARAEAEERLAAKVAQAERAAEQLLIDEEHEKTALAARGEAARSAPGSGKKSKRKARAIGRAAPQQRSPPLTPPAAAPSQGCHPAEAAEREREREAVEREAVEREAPSEEMASDEAEALAALVREHHLLELGEVAEAQEQVEDVARDLLSSLRELRHEVLEVEAREARLESRLDLGLHERRVVLEEAEVLRHAADLDLRRPLLIRLVPAHPDVARPPRPPPALLPARFRLVPTIAQPRPRRGVVCVYMSSVGGAPPPSKTTRGASGIGDGATSRGVVARRKTAVGG